MPSSHLLKGEGGPIPNPPKRVELQGVADAALLKEVAKRTYHEATAPRIKTRVNLFTLRRIAFN